MSAKKRNKKKTGKRIALWAIIVIEVVLLAACLLVWWAFGTSEKPGDDDRTTNPSAVDTTATTPPDPSAPPVVEELQDIEAYLDKGLKIINVGAYTGIYMEDGSDEVVSGVLMLVVTNVGDTAIQYAEITLPTEGGDAMFKLSTLPVGESCVLLEQTRMAHTGNEDISKATAANVAIFREPLSLCEEQLKFQALDGILNVINISGEDITGDIVVYYKNAAADLYYGGITYRVRLTGGMKQGEIKQLVADHFSDSGSKIMFVTIG